MTTYTINSECGIMQIEAADVESAKEICEREKHFDFNGARAGEYPGSWYLIDEDGVRVEDCTTEMPQ